MQHNWSVTSWYGTGHEQKGNMSEDKVSDFDVSPQRDACDKACVLADDDRVL